MEKKYLLIIIINLATISTFSQSDTLADQLVKAQIANQTAQAEYYQRQAERKDTKESIWSDLSGIIATMVGALLALAGGVLASLRESRREEKNWQRLKRDEIVKETRLAVAELTKKLSIALQAMQWATWKARYDSVHASSAELIDYDNQMKTLWPEISQARIGVAALNKEVHDKMMPLISKVSELDNNMSKAITVFRNSPEAALDALKACGHETDKFNEQFVNKIADILNLPNRDLLTNPREIRTPL